MRIGILSSPESWYFRDLQRAAGTQYRLECLDFKQLCGFVQTNGDCRYRAGENELQQFDAILVRTMPPGSLEQVVFRMDILGQYVAAGGVVINPPRALEIAVDKFLTSAKLAQAGLPTPRTVVCQTVDDALAAFEQLGRDVVIKPLFGGEGRGITRINDEALAWRSLKLLEQLGAVFYLQEYLPHDGYDCRLFVLGSRVFAMKRKNPLDWRTNVSRGATTQEFEPPRAWCEMALQACQAVGALVAGVDLLPAKNGTCYVLEVNAVPGWKALAPTLGIDIAAEVLEYTREQVEAQRGGTP